MFNSILVPTDGSPESDKVVQAAVELAAQLHSNIVGISVAAPYPFSPLSELAAGGEAANYEEKTRALAQERVERIKKAAEAHNVRCETVVEQSFSPSDEILNAAEKYHCDAIFMASHGRKGIGRLFVGSETQKVLAHSPIPVTVFH
jgi:nucleotide-binding universal stress UspA family protein